MPSLADFPFLRGFLRLEMAHKFSPPAKRDMIVRFLALMREGSGDEDATCATGTGNGGGAVPRVATATLGAGAGGRDPFNILPLHITFWTGLLRQ